LFDFVRHGSQFSEKPAEDRLCPVAKIVDLGQKISSLLYKTNPVAANIGATDFF
jgi:hypothetical protein